MHWIKKQRKSELCGKEKMKELCCSVYYYLNNKTLHNYGIVVKTVNSSLTHAFCFD